MVLAMAVVRSDTVSNKGGECCVVGDGWYLTGGRET